MKINIQNILYLLFFLGLFFFSFNQYDGISVLGEYRKDGGALFFFLGILIMSYEILKTNKIFVPLNNILFQLILLFFLWSFITFIFNFPTIKESYFKKTTGINRFIRQYFSLALALLGFVLFFWRVIASLSFEDVFYKIRKVFSYSFIFTSIYSVIEILISFFNVYSLLPLLKLFGYLPFMKPVIHGYGRISGIAYEAPFLAIYLITVTPWILSYILTEKKLVNKYFPTLVLLILTFFNGSRTGMIVILIQIFLFFMLIYKNKILKREINFIVISLLAISLMGSVFKGPQLYKAFSEKIESLDFGNNMKSNISNKTRFGMQYTSLMIFKDNPITGVGFGQQAYHSRLIYPYWATVDNYEFDLYYKNKHESSFPPGYNLYTRLAAETGIIGLLIFFGLIFYSIYYAYKLFKIYEYSTMGILSLICLISLTGLYINWMQIDTFRMYGVWLSLVILIRLTHVYTKNQKKIETKTNL